MLERNWFSPKTRDEIAYITDHIPVSIVEHVLDLIERMDHGDGDIQYRRRLIEIIHEAIKYPSDRQTVSHSNVYDVYHEFCLYLDGWIWIVESTDGTGNLECGNIKMKPLKCSPLA